MPKKHNKRKISTSELEQAARNHAERLDLNTLDAYRLWCTEHGFSIALNKSVIQMASEVAYQRRHRAEARIKQHSKESGLVFQLHRFHKANPEITAIADPVLRELANGFRLTKNRDELLSTLLTIEQRSKLLLSAVHAKAVVACQKHCQHWVRDLNNWQPRTRSASRQASSLIRHCFAIYDVPAFMDNAWLSGKDIQQRWFIHLGRGQNIRTADLPVKLTKAMAHHFVSAPGHYDAYAAIRWGQVMSIGGNSSLAHAFNQTRLNEDFRDDHFWQRVIQFFVENPMLDIVHVQPIVDYIWNQKYEPQVIFVERGVAQEIAPPHPNFSMQGRSAHTLLRQVEQWHDRLGREIQGGDYQWRKSLIRDFKYSEGSKENGHRCEWAIYELLSSKELVAEGRVQGHCVASYAQSCFRGKTSIWTMDYADSAKIIKHLTIELRMNDYMVCQIRGVKNRCASDAEMRIVNRWMVRENLKLSRFLVR